MADSSLVPAARAAIVGAGNAPTPEFHRFLRAIAKAAGLTGDIQSQVVEITKQITEIQETGQGTILAGPGIDIQGLLSLGFATISLADSGVDSGVYGDASHIAQISVDEFGRIVDVNLVPVIAPYHGGFTDPTTTDGDLIIRKVTTVNALPVLFIGDSITAGQLVTTAPVGPCATDLSLGAVTVTGINEGVPATKVSDWLPGGANFVAAVAAGASAGSRLAHVMLGTNDVISSVSPSTYRANMASLCGGLIAAGYTVVVSYPPYSPTYFAGLATYCAAIDSLVDNFHVFLGDTQSQVYFKDNPSALQPDNIHPTQAGSNVLAGLWASAMQALVNGMTNTTALQRAVIGGELRADYSGASAVLTTTEVLRVAFSGATAGSKRRLAIPQGLTIESWEVIADATGSLVLDIYAGSYATYPPTASICGSAKPTITSSNRAKSSTLTGWTPGVADDSALVVNVDSISTIAEFELSLRCVHTYSAPPVVTAYFDVANAAAEIVVSNGTRNIQRSSSNQPNWRSAFSAVSHSSGKYYVEFEVIALDAGATGGSLVGFGDSGASLNSFVGSTADGFGLQNNTGGGTANAWNNSTLTTTGISKWGTVGAWARAAVDFGAGKIWLGVAGGWAGGGDPATGASPTYTFTPGMTLFAIGSQESSPAEIKMNAQTGEFKSTVPSGFSPWIP